MTTEQKQAIINSGKEYFRTIIIPNHVNKLKSLSLKDFDFNPFLINYLAAFLCGNTEPESLAKALVYPRILATSINTSFGQNIQIFISQLKEVVGGASGIDGIDIEFVDALDGRRKYCQCKAGPQTINKDDVATILGHFKKLVGKARLDKMPLQTDDMIVGILYGEKMSANYKTINAAYPVYMGSEFWERLTGDKDFYNRLLLCLTDVIEDDSCECYDDVRQIVKNISTELASKCPSFREIS